MIIREYTPSDDQALRDIHASQGHDYPFPDLSHPQFVGVYVVEDEGRIVQAVAARKTVEVYFMGDRKWNTPAWRLVTFGRLHLALHQAMLKLGFTDSQCCLPPSVAKSFGRRLQEEFGWLPSRWNWFTKYL